MIMKTYSLKKEEVQRNWFVVDATDRVLGRVATKIADKIRGKDKPTFTPHTDGGDYVIVINAEKIKVTGSKFDNKIYYRHSLYPGGLKSQTFKELNKNNPERIIEEAVNFNKRQYGEAKGGGGSIKNRIALIKRTFKYILKLREKIDHSK